MKTWLQWGEAIVDWLPYATLAAAAILIVTLDPLEWSTSLLANPAAAWVYLMYTRAARPRNTHRVRMIVYYAGLLVLAGVLVTRHPLFLIFTVSGYIHAPESPEFEVVGEASNGVDAVAYAESLQPDVILMDLRMPGGDGLTAIRQLTAHKVESRVLVLTTYDSDNDVVPAIHAGATGYLLKDAPREELVRAVRAAYAGESVLSPSVASRLLRQVRSPVQETLSERELEVLTLIAKGFTNRAAAARLFISEATVKTHLIHIYAKLGVADRAAAVATAFERGLLTPDSR